MAQRAVQRFRRTCNRRAGSPAAGRPQRGAGPARFAGADRPRGFTLIELLIVIAIISLLLAIAAPSLMEARTAALRALCLGNLRQIDVAMTMYVNNSNGTYPCARDPVSTDPYYWLWMGRGWREFVEPYLGADVNEKNPSVLFCKADPAARDQYEATSYAYSMAFYHSPEQINGTDSPKDTYSNPQPPVGQQTSRVRRPARKILIGEWTSNHRRVDDDGGWWCWSGWRNFLFADGHAENLPASQIAPARDGYPDANLTVDGILGEDVK